MTPTETAVKAEDTTLVEQIDSLVADILAAAKAPSLASILVIVQQVVGFIVFFGIIDNTQAGEAMAIINAAVGLGVLVAHAVHQYAAHKTVNGIVQAKLLMENGWPTPKVSGTLTSHRIGGHARGE